MSSTPYLLKDKVISPLGGNWGVSDTLRAPGYVRGILVQIEPF
jgi:hypothetical protein